MTGHAGGRSLKDSSDCEALAPSTREERENLLNIFGDELIHVAGDGDEFVGRIDGELIQHTAAGNIGRHDDRGPGVARRDIRFHLCLMHVALLLQFSTELNTCALLGL